MDDKVEETAVTETRNPVGSQPREIRPPGSEGYFQEPGNPSTDEPHITLEPRPSEPVIEPTIKDDLLSDMGTAKEQFQGSRTNRGSLDDLLDGIPKAKDFSTYEIEDEEEAAEPVSEPEPKNSGSMVNLVVKNSDWALSTVIGWLNDRPRSNFQADADGKELLTEAVSNYTTELAIEFDPKAQLIWSYGLVYGGGLFTGILHRGKALFEKLFRKKRSAAPTAPTKPGEGIEDAEVVEQTTTRYCAFPGCKKELTTQKRYCSTSHSAQDARNRSEREKKDKK